MMEENNDIFVAGSDTLVYLAEPMQKKYSTTLIWGHAFSTYVTYHRFFNVLPLYTSIHILDYPSPFPEKINGSVGLYKDSEEQY